VTLERGKRYILGRNESSDIVVENSCVSGRHAILTVGDTPTIVDVGSRNSTYVDGQQLAPQVACPLRVGSVIMMGPVSLFASQGEVFSSGVHPVFDRKKAEAGDVANFQPVMRDPGMLQLYALAQQIARSTVTVLITGETGVGKELIAQAIHSNSPRARRGLVVLNCAAIPESLVESELFGYERGAFSGAVAAKPGLFEAAHGSTIFLDEIGELALAVQAKLLRVLETGEVSRLGALRPTRVDVRIVAATNRHLPAEIARGAFRADLYYRLNGLTISVPPLRARPEDIEVLARHFAAMCSPDAKLEFSDAALAALQAHSWPGNVRELKSVIERVVLVNPGKLVEPEHLMLDPAPRAPAAGAFEEQGAGEPAGETTAQYALMSDELTNTMVRAELERRELRRIREALERTAGNQTEAARLLGISRRTLMNRMDRLGISRPRKGAARNSDD
jgi:transcriptional regulator with GAF, ATPase, and Fis domain